MRAGLLFLALMLATTVAPPIRAASDLDPQTIAGVYKNRFKDGLVTGETYQGEDILEIVPVSAKTAYIRTHIDAYNGHICSLSGLAKAQGPSLVFHALPEYSQAPTCVLTIALKGSSLVMHDPDNACKNYFCGMSAIFEGQTFGLSHRRPIGYMKRLLASPQYAAAISGKWR